jgi:hypothetical protein
MTTLLMPFVLAYLGMVTLANTQTPDPWIGKRIFIQFGAILQTGDGVLDDEKRSDNIAVLGKDRKSGRVYRVEHTKRVWHWLQDENSGASGWVYPAGLKRRLR